MTLQLAVGLDTKVPAASHGRLFADLAGRIDQAADLVTIEDGFAAGGGDGLDALLLANWLGARTSQVGLIAGAALSFAEPFHVSTAIATLDYVTQGRAGLLAQPLRGERAERARQAIGALNGFPETDPASLAKDQAEAIEVIRLLWDSWEDDAVIRDSVSQRFVDGSKLHYIGFKGARYSVLGPSITPRPPQGQPVVATSLTTGDDPAAAAGSDLVFLAANDEDATAAMVASLRAANGGPLIFADVLFSLGRHAETDHSGLRWTGAAEGLANQAREWGTRFGLAGLRFLPADLGQDLEPLLASVLPALQAAAPSAGTTLRNRLGLPDAPNRYAARRAAA